MCGRFNLRTSAARLAELFDLISMPSLLPRYNVAPTQPVLAVHMPHGGEAREATFFSWGLIPSWAKDPSVGARMLNARSETAATKPSFRAAMKRRRCLIPADGFYEWQKNGRAKQPFHILRQDEQPLAFAGLWEHWESADGSQIQSCTILTTEANDVLRPIHDRMPVILDRENFSQWLDPRVEDAAVVEPLLRPCPPDWLRAYPVSNRVNRPANDDASCIEPLQQERRLFDA